MCREELRRRIDPDVVLELELQHANQHAIDNATLIV
jgi:hypothetical protein